MFVVEMTCGLFLGLLCATAFVVFRPVLRMALVTIVLAMVVVLFAGGVTGLVDVLARIAEEIGQHGPFFASLAVGKLIGAVLVLR